MLSFACIVTSSSQKGVLIRLWVMGFQIEKKKGEDLILVFESLIVVTMQLR